MRGWNKDFYDVNLFRPNKGYMGGEVVTMLEILVGWGIMTFGFQFLVWLLSDSGGRSLLTRFVFFNLPFHFWFTGQFLPLWFIILCIIFNYYIDRLTSHHSRKRDRTYE
jgi:putative solute:sodium symporter small subunit